MALRRKKQHHINMMAAAAAGSLWGVFLVSLGTLFIYLLNGIEWTGARFNPGDIFLGFIIMLIVAVVEEYLFRGLILRKLAVLINRWIALVISSALFTAVHLANSGITRVAIANIFLGGLVFGIMYMATRSLAFVAGLHFSWNFVQGPLIGFPVSGLSFETLFTIEKEKEDIINGGSFGFEGSIVCTVQLSVLVIFLLIFYNRIKIFTPARADHPSRK